MMGKGGKQLGGKEGCLMHTFILPLCSQITVLSRDTFRSENE